MSYVYIFQDHSSSLLALGMLFDAPLATFLSERPQVQKIRFCLDNDDSGRMASGALIQKYCGLGYETEDRPPPEGCKDYNQWLQETKNGSCRTGGGPGRKTETRMMPVGTVSFSGVIFASWH